MGIKLTEGETVKELEQRNALSVDLQNELLNEQVMHYLRYMITELLC